MRHFVNIISSLKCKERLGIEKPLQSMYHFLKNAATTISHLDVHSLTNQEFKNKKEKTKKNKQQISTERNRLQNSNL